MQREQTKDPEGLSQNRVSVALRPGHAHHCTGARTPRPPRAPSARARARRRPRRRKRSRCSWGRGCKVPKQLSEVRILLERKWLPLHHPPQLVGSVEVLSLDLVSVSQTLPHHGKPFSPTPKELERCWKMALRDSSVNLFSAIKWHLRSNR